MTVAKVKIAAVPDWFPESATCSLDGFRPRIGCKLPGYGPEILDFLFAYLNINYEIVKLPLNYPTGSRLERNGMPDR